MGLKDTPQIEMKCIFLIESTNHFTKNNILPNLSDEGCVPIIALNGVPLAPNDVSRITQRIREREEEGTC